MSQELIQRRTELSANIVTFCRYLRTQGYTISPSEEADALRALQFPQAFQTHENMGLIFRTIFCKSLKQYLAFEELFTNYWKELERAVDAKVKDKEEAGKPRSKNKGSQKPQGQSLQEIKDWLLGNQNEEETQLATYSPMGALAHKDFSGFGEEEVQEIIKLIRVIARSLATRLQRRYVRAKHAPQLDLRRSLRKNLRRGGEMLELAFRKKRIRKLKMVILCDVSKSMDLYARFLVQFMYAFQQVYHRVETFAFSHSLHRISEQLEERDFTATLNKLSETVPGWSSGTRIGYSFSQLIDQYVNLIDDRTVLMILSDGWDTGELEVLENSMAYFQKKCAKVVWLNPLAGNENFTPEAGGMAKAMPYIDIFAPAHNVDSLRKVINKLG